MFNPKTITDEASAEIEVKNPVTGEGVGAFVTLAGPEHPDRKALEFARQRKVRAAVTRTGKFEAPEPEDYELELTDKLVACTLGWKGIGEDNVETPFTKAAAQALFSDPKTVWLRDQLLAALGDRDRFIKTSATA